MHPALSGHSPLACALCKLFSMVAYRHNTDIYNTHIHIQGIIVSEVCLYSRCRAFSLFPMAVPPHLGTPLGTGKILYGFLLSRLDNSFNTQIQIYYWHNNFDCIKCISEWYSNRCHVTSPFISQSKIETVPCMVMYLCKAL